MISHWFSPDDKSSIKPERISKASLWHNVSFIENEELVLSGSDLLIISMDRVGSQRIKKILYQFSHTPASALRIIDCGILHQKQPDAIIPILKEISEAGAKYILLGPPVNFMRHQVAGLRMVSIIKESNLDDDIHLRSDKPSAALQYIATQRHLIAESQHNIEGHLRLSELKEEINLAEPCIRDSEALLFHCDSLSAAEAGYLTGMSGSGLTTIEACQLFRYGGGAPSLYSIGVYGYSHEEDSLGFVANSIAQMIWYFLEGSTLREDPDKSTLTQYVVQPRDHEHALMFYKSEISGRWWILNKAGGKTPCSYQDYRQACDEDYSPLVIKSVLG